MTSYVADSRTAVGYSKDANYAHKPSASRLQCRPKRRKPSTSRMTFAMPRVKCVCGIRVNNVKTQAASIHRQDKQRRSTTLECRRRAEDAAAGPGTGL